MEHLFMGSDVSKGYCDFVILNQQEEVLLENFQLDDTYSGHNNLKHIVDDMFRTYKDATLHVGFESTGGYENNWFNFFLDLVNEYDIKLVRLNPKGVYHHIKSVQRNVITDKESAKSIAEYLIRNKDRIRFNEEVEGSDLKKQWSFIQLMVKQSTQLQNQLEKNLYAAHPQLFKYCRKSKPEWFLTLISKYPTARRLSKASVKSISKIPYLSESKARILKEEAKQSIASLISESSEFLIQSIINQILNVQTIIKEQKAFLINSIKSPEVELLKSFSGIGDYTACGLMLLIGRVQRFASPKKLASFFGLHPVFKQSGDRIGGTHMSKEGRKEARYLLFNVVMCAITSNPWMKELYEKYQNNGKAKLSAIGILMHKVIRIIYGMLKNKTEYDPEIDKKNIERSKKGKTNLCQNKTRRYQNFDTNAPISKRHSKKRKEQMERKKKEQVKSQNEKIIVNEIISPAVSNLR